jgi:hypothetical protein
MQRKWAVVRLETKLRLEASNSGQTQANQLAQRGSMGIAACIDSALQRTVKFERYNVNAPHRHMIVDATRTARLERWASSQVFVEHRSWE